MAEYPYRTSSMTESSPSKFEHPLQSTKQIRRVQWLTNRLPVARTSCYIHHCSQSRGEREDRAVFLLIFGNWLQAIDGGAHSKFRRIRMSDFFYVVGGPLLGADKYTLLLLVLTTTTYITSFSVGVGVGYKLKLSRCSFFSCCLFPGAVMSCSNCYILHAQLVHLINE